MRYLRTASALALAVTCGTLYAATPNILLILTDDHGWSQSSISMDDSAPQARSDYLETPNMAKLAHSGMRFSAGYSPAPLCTPTRRSILCGTSAARSGPEFASKWVPKDHATIPRILKSANANYRCAHFGKWGEQMISTPEECGYDASDGMTGNRTGGMPSSLGVQGSHEDGPPFFLDEKDPKRTNTVTARAIQFMSEQAREKRPFFVQVSYYAQHLSVVTSSQMLAKYKEKGVPDRGYTQAWAAMMEQLDTGIGSLMDAVDRLGIGDNTYIVMTADNGGRGTVPGGSLDRLPPNAPLTGAKHSLYEGGIRVPFVVAGPGVQPGTECVKPVVGYDFLPTFFDLAGGAPEQLSAEVDGASFAPLLDNPTSATLARKAGAIVFHRPQRLFSVLRQDHYKLILFWKRDGAVDRCELYDLSANPTEEGHDLAAERPQQVEKMKTTLLDFLKSVQADRPNSKARKRQVKAAKR